MQSSFLSISTIKKMQMLPTNQSRVEYNYILTDLNDELGVIKLECYNATKTFFKRLFNENDVNLVSQKEKFEEFCLHMAHNMAMYYINSQLTDTESPISVQYKIKNLAYNIKSDTLESYYCEFLMSYMLLNKKTIEYLTDIVNSMMEQNAKNNA